MIAYTDIFNINFYKKEIFHGSFQGMRYQIEKTDTEDGPILTVTHWPGPYNFAVTPEEQKKCSTFAFSNEGLHQAADYLNQEHALHYTAV